MGFPGMEGGGPYYIPDPIGVVELKLGDAWRARWSDADELPANAPVFYAYAVPCMGDKGYVTRRQGDTAWGVIEGPLQPGETPRDFVVRGAREQVGATVDRVILIGFLDCKATSHNPDFQAGEITVRPIYLAIASEVGDVPEDSPFERRRLPLNEFARAIRAHYPELNEEMQKALSRYIVMRAKGEA